MDFDTFKEMLNEADKGASEEANTENCVNNEEPATNPDTSEESEVQSELIQAVARSEQEDAAEPDDSDCAGETIPDSEENPELAETSDNEPAAAPAEEPEPAAYKEPRKQEESLCPWIKEEDPRDPMERYGKKKKNPLPLKRVIAAALIFGLIAGSVSFGIDYFGNRYIGGKYDRTVSEAKILTETQPDAAGVNPSEDHSVGTVAEVTKNAIPSLVTISSMSVQEVESFFGEVETYETEGMGSGVIVGENDEELLIATNNHVVEDATEITVGFVNDELVEGFLKGTDPNNDLAVVGVKLKDIPEDTQNVIKVITIGDSDKLVLGEQVVAIGNSLGNGQAVTSGYVSGFDRELQLTDGRNSFTSSNLIQIDAAINTGNSGGALLNMKGELVGINEAKSSMISNGAIVDNVGYSIPISKAKPILENLMSLKTKEKVDEEQQGFLGIICADVNSETAARYNIPVGVYLRDVSKEGPAGAAGLVTGDVIVKFDGKIISTYSNLKTALSYCSAGEEIEVVYMHMEKGEYVEKTAVVTLSDASILETLAEENEDFKREGMENQGNIGD